MEIKITTILNVSEENAGLLPVVTSQIGYEGWKSQKINEARTEARNNTTVEDLPNFTFDESTVDVTTETFVKEYLSKDAIQRLTNLIAPSVEKYFGLAQKATADAIKEQLKTAITSVVGITE